VAISRLETDTRILIIGAGVVGAALADDLTRQGMTSVTVVDQGPLYRTGGSSSHAPGFAFQTTGSAVMSELAKRTLDKLDGLDLDGEWILKRVGGLELACDEERLQYLHRRHNLAQSWGIPARVVSPAECGELFPGLDTSSVLGGLHTPTDGVVKAVRAVEWQARRAISNGARFYGHTQVTGFRIENGRIAGVDVRATPPVPGNPSAGEHLPEGTTHIDADIVVVCAGLWGPGLGKLLGLEIPMVPMEHCSSHTTALPSLNGTPEDVEVSLPMVRHQATGSYFRQMGERLAWGTYEHRVIPVEQSEIASPEEYAESQVEPAIHPLTWNDLEDGWSELQRLFPDARNCQPDEGYNGIFSFTPDGNPLLGEVPGISGLWLGESVWLTQSAGVAGVLADWIVTGDPGIDTTSLDFRRFDQTHLTRTASIERASENYDEVYDIAHPRKQTQKLRKFATTPFYVRQETLGAVFGSSQGGWERPLWYDTTTSSGASSLRDDWGTYGWSPKISAEARQASTGVGLADRGSSNVFEIRGRNAGKHLQHLCAATIDLEVGTAEAVLMPSPSGGLAADLTVIRTSDEAYLVIGSSPEDLWHLRQESPHSEGLSIADVSSAMTGVALIGPGAGGVLASVTRGAVPKATSGQAPLLDIGGIPVRATSENTTGLGGWALYTPTEHGLYLWDLLLAAGAQHGITPIGDAAFDALRIVNGVPAFGTDFGPQDNSFEAGLNGSSPAAAARPGHRILVQLRLTSKDAAVLPGEPVAVDGEVVGYISSAAEDPDLGSFLAFAWVDRSAAALTTQVTVAHIAAQARATVVRSPFGAP
jgi:glycine cleavage system aminomethyltransferase T/glycine/D-amino acid oxidase-like deaminating enzyme